jgi:hypothetical protein
MRIRGPFSKLITRVETRYLAILFGSATGEKRDMLAVGADGGALSILDFENGVCKIIAITFGKVAAADRRLDSSYRRSQGPLPLWCPP